MDTPISSPTEIAQTPSMNQTQKDLMIQYLKHSPDIYDSWNLNDGPIFNGCEEHIGFTTDISVMVENSDIHIWINMEYYINFQNNHCKYRDTEPTHTSCVRGGNVETEQVFAAEYTLDSIHEFIKCMDERKFPLPDNEYTKYAKKFHIVESDDYFAIMKILEPLKKIIDAYNQNI